MGFSTSAGVAAAPFLPAVAIVRPERHGALWLLIAFVLTTVITRWVTRRIRSRALKRIEGVIDEQPDGLIKDIMIAGVHIHHQVWGILLVLVVGLFLITYHPSGWVANLLAALFGVGAALTLDEFAIWLHLEDVYWSTEGRTSITALMVAATITLALVLGLDPLDVSAGASGTPLPGYVLAGVALLNLALVVVCILKGKLSLGLVGLFLPVLAFVGAIRLAKPGSWWANRRYPPGGGKDRASRERFGPEYHRLFDRLRDLIGGEHTETRETRRLRHSRRGREH
ncbi:hypothetical protein [Arsenicicoccus piscis]|uniref:Uncharacterized protein n=1 Tax=Arsenicicoccus piscis TaxID=673954 RepID=A0ABQ6HTC5_9MICO|nr:hypothetical protein [Arsenicicoccus piscis]GMA21760.1 hypothetical protein GCM10025862_37810 [Arsenicicoccus piscis]